MMSKLGKLMEVYNILTWLTRLLISDLAGFENNIQYITLIDTRAGFPSVRLSVVGAHHGPNVRMRSSHRLIA